MGVGIPDQQPTMVQATATGSALLALRDKGFTVEELNPMQLCLTSPDGQSFILTVQKVGDHG